MRYHADFQTWPQFSEWKSLNTVNLTLSEVRYAIHMANFAGADEYVLSGIQLAFENGVESTRY